MLEQVLSDGCMPLVWFHSFGCCCCPVSSSSSSPCYLLFFLPRLPPPVTSCFFFLIFFLLLRFFFAVVVVLFFFCEPVWPSCKERGLGSNQLRLSFLFKSCGLWTLSCDFVLHNYETLKWLLSLPILMQESFWW